MRADADTETFLHRAFYPHNIYLGTGANPS